MLDDLLYPCTNCGKKITTKEMYDGSVCRNCTDLCKECGERNDKRDLVENDGICDACLCEDDEDEALLD